MAMPANASNGDPRQLLIDNAHATRFPRLRADFAALTQSYSGDTTQTGFRLRTMYDERPGGLWAALVRRQSETPDDNRFLVRQTLPGALGGGDPPAEIWYWNGRFADSTGVSSPFPVWSNLSGVAMTQFDLVLPGYEGLTATELSGSTPINGPGQQPVNCRVVEVTFNSLPSGAKVDRFRIWLDAAKSYEYRVEEYLGQDVKRVAMADGWAAVSIPNSSDVRYHPNERVYCDDDAGLRTTLTTTWLSTEDFPDAGFTPFYLGQSW
jgi:hypothetical protein